MKKRSYSALQGNVSSSPEPGASGATPMCVACPLPLWLSCFSLQSPAIPLFACFKQHLVHLLLVGQCGTALDLSWIRLGICQNCGHNKLQVTLSFCPLRDFHWWAGPAVRLVSTGTAAELVSEYISLSSGQQWCCTLSGPFAQC